MINTPGSTPDLTATEMRQVCSNVSGEYMHFSLFYLIMRNFRLTSMEKLYEEERCVYLF